MKSYSSVAIILSLLITLIIPTYESSQASINYCNLVENGFKESGANLKVLNTQVWTKISTDTLMEKELLDLHEKIISSLDLTSKPQVDNEHSGFIHVFQKEQKSPDVYVETSLQAISQKGKDAGTYLGILVFANDFSTSSLYYDRIERIISDLKIKGEIGVTATGTFAGDLKQDTSKAKIKEILAALNAEIQEGINSEGLISVSGYSATCPDYLSVNGQKININIAMRYHALDDQTYIHVGAPLIYEEY